jgi:hypothetical protein
MELILKSWSGLHELHRGLIDVWHSQVGGLRQFLKGWGANLGRQECITKARLMARIQELDQQVDGQGLDEDGWALRYHLEEQMVQILSAEVEYWRQRGRQNWILKGDANTKYFHAFANGRRRKCATTCLNSEAGPVTDQHAIQRHIYDFYLALLMGTEEPKPISLDAQIWEENSIVSEEENADVMRSFTSQELDEVLSETKTNTAPGLDGFPVAFFKKFWPILKSLVLQILNGFALGTVDISRLNFGILSLIPK